MSEDDGPHVHDQGEHGTYSAAFWALVIGVGLALFVWDFGNVVVRPVGAVFPLQFIHDLQQTLFVIAILGGGSTVAIVGYIVFAHSRPNRDAPTPLRTGYGKYTLALFTVGMTFLLVTTIFMGSATLAQTDEARNPAAQFDTDRSLDVQIEGAQWAWRYDVAGVPYTQAETLVVPADTVVEARISSADVIHSFAIQELGVKKDAVPGQYNTAWFMVGEVTGETELTVRTADGTTTVPADTYRINCAELCGKGHSTMVGELVVLSPEDYRTWVEANGGTVPESFEAGGDGEDEEDH